MQEETYGLNFVPPKNLVIAHSMIQQWYVAETKGQPFEKDFFTLEHTMAFFKITVAQCFIDSVVWLVVYVLGGAFVFYIQEHYLAQQTTQFYFWISRESVLYFFTKLSSFASLAFSTILCIMMSRYYTGVVPKLAINAVFFTRALFLFCFALVAFLLLGMVYKILENEMLLKNIFGQLHIIKHMWAYNLYNFITGYFRRFLFESAIVILVSSAVSVLLPFFTIGFFRIYKRRKSDLGIEVS